uniref:Carboxylic ester hydrolase n=1 Tax=Pristhesancus plagipennis TaxID=1955184 RepID=A0A2K8JMJ0_PRIPG|nr:secreted Carboxylesterase-like protein [Pristhesancus plagipennis]
MVNSELWGLLLVILFNSCDCLEVETKLGKIIGEERTSRDGKTYYAFTSIPYAKPPLGKLRFKNPVKVERWEGVLEANKPLPLCIQIPSFIPSQRDKPVGQEDCLYLSVFTPDVSPKQKMPVMIYVHGGGFRCGDAGPKNGADNFMDENVVMVNFHYRLAALGFLSTEDSLIPGNFGLKDQAMALKWVYDNIDSFGGDGNKITVFGESAGGASTHYLATSPLTKHLLKGVISESGVVNKYWSYGAPGTAKPLVEEVARKVGCGDKSDHELLDCLQAVDALKLIKVELDFLFWDFDPAVVFRPVQEPNTEGAFMPFDPLVEKIKLPWLTGVVANEGILKTGSLLTQDSSVTQDFIDNIDEFLPKLLYLNNSCPKVKKTSELLKNRYFPEPITVESARQGLGDLYSDAFFIYPMGEAIRNHKRPLYQYYFDYRGANSLIDQWGDLKLGVSHADELLLLFNWKEKFPKISAQDEAVSKTLVNMWANFARKQIPSSNGNTDWPDGSVTHEYLHIADKFSIKKNLKKDIIDWWSELPIYRSNVKSEL